MESICPLPIHWHEVFKKLSDAAANSDANIPPPPIPLVLNGWVYSNDLEKSERWRQTIDWAKMWDFTAIIQELTPDMMHRVENPTSYEIGPLGGPMKLPWNFEPKPLVSEEESARAVSRIRADWAEISGPNLSGATRPLRLTGKKRRRLVVYADPSATPPWGTWSTLTSGSDRREFTRLRAAVNAAICPLEIDHIDFVHDNPDQEP